MKDHRREAASDDKGRGNSNPRTGALEQQPKNQPEEGREQHGKVVGRMTHRMLVVGHPLLSGRRVLMMVLVQGNRRSGAKVQSPKDPVAEDERAHEKERQKPTSGLAE